MENKPIYLDHAASTPVHPQVVEAMLGSDVFPMIKSLGIGARGLDTPAEREFLMKVMTGSIALEKDALIRMTEIRRNIAKRAIEKYNARVKSGQMDRFFTSYGVPKAEIPVPSLGGGSDAAPEGVDPETWKYMTPEQKKLWQ